MTDKDRIRLAEAMGWKREHVNEPTLSVNGLRWITPEGALLPFHKNEVPPFDPFTDANDAYAAHEFFMSGDKAEEYKDALFELVVRPGRMYSRGQDVTPWHWPRAALKVIDND